MLHHIFSRIPIAVKVILDDYEHSFEVLLTITLFIVFPLLSVKASSENFLYNFHGIG